MNKPSRKSVRFAKTLPQLEALFLSIWEFQEKFSLKAKVF